MLFIALFSYTKQLILAPEPYLYAFPPLSRIVYHVGISCSVTTENRVSFLEKCQQEPVNPSGGFYDSTLHKSFFLIPAQANKRNNFFYVLAGQFSVVLFLRQSTSAGNSLSRFQHNACPGDAACFRGLRE